MIIVSSSSEVQTLSYG